MAIKYGVFQTGGTLADQERNKKPWFVFDTKEEAKEKAKRLRKLLSQGERKYYRYGFNVQEIKESK